MKVSRYKVSYKDILNSLRLDCNDIRYIGLNHNKQNIFVNLIYESREASVYDYNLLRNLNILNKPVFKINNSHISKGYAFNVEFNEVFTYPLHIFRKANKILRDTNRIFDWHNDKLNNI